MGRFQIDAAGLTWLGGMPDDPQDLRLHGCVTAVIGEQTFTCGATVSAAALYLLKSLTEEHRSGEGLQMLPCCGFSLYADDARENVTIIGCKNGIDWTVLHEGDAVRLIPDGGEETVVPLREYRAEVERFADKIEAFYLSCTPKALPEDVLARVGYVTFWKEWRRRRNA